MNLPSIPSTQVPIVGPTSSLHIPNMKGMADNFRKEIAEVATETLNVKMHNSTQKDEATRLIGRFTSTIDTLNQILQKV